MKKSGRPATQKTAYLATQLNKVPIGDAFYLSGVLDREIGHMARRMGIKVKTQNMFAFASKKPSEVERLVKVIVVSRPEIQLNSK